MKMLILIVNTPVAFSLNTRNAWQLNKFKILRRKCGFHLKKKSEDRSWFFSTVCGNLVNSSRILPRCLKKFWPWFIYDYARITQRPPREFSSISINIMIKFSRNPKQFRTVMHPVLFSLQSGVNYAVCLELYPSRLLIVHGSILRSHIWTTRF